MSLHDEIMRLEMQEDRYALPYANGYSDARDDAAELACKTDAEIERLSALNSALTAERDIVIAVAAAERETCARICETSSSLEEAAHLIRARSAK